ncbi:acyl-CoA Delta-12 desaturase-like [Zophobas morio]|uniref:acyl-CoA Delta-12 desaturase-like n=1 Tax=Zophobas morio TaxID=2755281 RepID=UPI0030829EAA
MPPQSRTDYHQTVQSKSQPQLQRQYRWKIVWRNIFLYLLMHAGGLYGFYLMFGTTQWKTIFYSWLLLILGLLGTTAGSHRLWAHKSYKATLPLKMILVIFQTLSLQKYAYDWATDHRVHHKYVDTDADPHSSRRGLFFSHVGWLFLEREPEFVEKYNKMDFSDLHADKALMFQKKYYFVFFAPVVGILLPAAIPWHFWGETFENAFFISTMLRYCLCTNITFLINSYAHVYGTKPYDKNICPVEVPTLTILTGGEGWHNYHHTFPWDYRTGELGKYRFNLTTSFLDLMAAIGWAYDLKTVSKEMVLRRAKRTGDGSRELDEIMANSGHGHHDHDEQVWGWGDTDMTQDHRSYVDIHNRKYD